MRYLDAKSFTNFRQVLISEYNERLCRKRKRYNITPIFLKKNCHAPPLGWVVANFALISEIVFLDFSKSGGMSESPVLGFWVRF